MVHVISGVVFFADYAPEGTPVLLYSLLYNGSYLLPEAVLVGAILYLLRVRRDIFEPGQ
jgi:thiamine transporter